MENNLKQKNMARIRFLAMLNHRTNRKLEYHSNID